MPDYSNIRGDAPRGRYGKPLGFPGGPHPTDPDVPRFPMKGDHMATVPETREFWENIIRGKDMEGAGGRPVANDPRAHYGTKEMGLDDIRQRIKRGEMITDEEGVKYIEQFSDAPEGRYDDKELNKELINFLEYLNRATEKNMAPENRRDRQEDIMRRST